MDINEFNDEFHDQAYKLYYNVFESLSNRIGPVFGGEEFLVVLEKSETVLVR